ncbi:MAG: hypothetical protein Q9175_002431 [Cornicularia normoerica]
MAQRKGGEAESYYDVNQVPGGQSNGQYAPPPPMQYPPQAAPPQAANNNAYRGDLNPKYQQPPPNYGQNFQESASTPMAAGDGKQTFDQVFKLDKPKYNDVWAGILLILTFLGFAAVSGISLQGYSANKRLSGGGIYNAGNTFSLNTNTIVLFTFVLVVALVLSWTYFTLARAFTKQFIWITGILNILFGIGTAIYYFVRHYYSAAVVFAVFGIFSIVCFITWIPRIPFSVVMLQQTMDVAKSFGHVFLVSAIGGIASVAFGAWLKNTIHSIVAGIYGSWFFCAGKPGGMPTGATRGAAKRAFTYSFGSISFGSLVVALINMVRQAVSIAQQQEAQGGNMAASIAFCCLGCIIGLIDWAVQFINRYAFIHIALYGKAYIPAAKDTWAMMKNRGIDALINDCLIGPVLTMGSTFVAYICALLAYLYLEFTKPGYNDGGTFTPVVMAFSFLIGLQICQIFMTPIGSGVDTIFVAAAWDPDVLMRDHPDLYQRMVRVYPKVQQMIHA